MPRPKGFGKNYFTLSAIQAYSAHVTLTRRMTTVIAYRQLFSDDEDVLESVTEDPLLPPHVDEPGCLQCSHSYRSTSHNTPSFTSSFLHVISPLPLKEYL